MNAKHSSNTHSEIGALNAIDAVDQPVSNRNSDVTKVLADEQKKIDDQPNGSDTSEIPNQEHNAIDKIKFLLAKRGPSFAALIPLFSGVQSIFNDPGLKKVFISNSSKLEKLNTFRSWLVGRHNIQMSSRLNRSSIFSTPKFALKKL